MEIALLTKSGLRIKGKQALIGIDPLDKMAYEAVLTIRKSPEEIIQQENSILIFAPGEYEVGGVKITGTRSESGMLYSLIVDGVSVLIGTLDALEKQQHKLKDHNIVVVDCAEGENASFITSLAENVVMFYGEKANTVASSFGKENVKQLNKYSSTKDKLPTEVETVLLASSV